MRIGTGRTGSTGAAASSPGERWVRRQPLPWLLGPAFVAAAAYVDHSPPPPPALHSAVPRRDRGAGRPTKKDRRELDRLRGL